MARDDLSTNAPDTGKGSYDAEIDADARAAYAEVTGQTPPGADAATIDKSVDSGADEKREVRDDGRDEKGRFAPKSGPSQKDDAAAAGDKGQADPAQAAGKQQPDGKAQAAADARPIAGGPPPSFSVKTKAAWDQLPDHVRADIAKREGEMQQGLAALRDYQDLKPFTELAKQHNTTVPAYLNHALRMENALRQNFGAGLAQIAVNFGLNQQQAAAVFADLARRFGGNAVAPAGAAPNAPQDPLYAALQPMLNPLVQQIQQLQGQLQSRTEADRNAQLSALERSVESFSSDANNRYFADVEETMTKLFETGMVPRSGNDAQDLKTAYDMAVRMHPDVSEALIEQRLREKQETQRKVEQEAADKARNASRSLTGSRMPGTTVKEAEHPRGSNYEDDLLADVQRAYRAHA